MSHFTQLQKTAFFDARYLIQCGQLYNDLPTGIALVLLLPEVQQMAGDAALMTAALHAIVIEKKITIYA